MMIKLTFKSELASGAAGLRYSASALRFVPGDGAVRRPLEPGADAPPVTETGAKEWHHAGRFARRVEDAFVVVTLVLLLALGAATAGYPLAPVPTAIAARAA
jgi:hypothetical protein